MRFLVPVTIQGLLLALQKWFLFLLSSENTQSIIPFCRKKNFAGQLQAKYCG